MSEENVQSTRKIFGLILPSWITEPVLKQLIYGILGLVVVLLVSMLFIWPKFTDLVKAEKEVARLTIQRDVLREAVANVDSFGVELGGIEAEAVFTAAPAYFDPGAIVTSLRGLSTELGVTLEDYQVERGGVEVEAEVQEAPKDTKVKVLKSHTVTVSLVGQSQRLTRFVNALGQTMPFAVISELSLSEVSRLLTEGGLVQLGMEINYYEFLPTKVDYINVAKFSEDNLSLLDELIGYNRYSTTESVQPSFVPRTKSIFGF